MASASLTVHGGTTWMRLKLANGSRPRDLHAAAARPSPLRAAVRRQRLPGRAVGDQVEGPEHAQPADLADHRVPLGQLPQAGPSTSSPMRLALSTMPSSCIALIVATIDAAASGWPE